MNFSTRARLHLDGVILLHKPLGISSQQAVSRVRHAFSAAKAGHTGTLDPAAEGLLPVCLGEATKFSHLLLGADKTYLATIRLGVTTTTGDAEGEVVASKAPVTDHSQILRALEKFRGEITQMPPMHSALKHHGVPLYEYARKGVEIARAPRRVYIHDLQVISIKDDLLTIKVRCSKGTYLRVVAIDIGAELGCGASLSALTRTQAGALDLAAACTLEALQAMTDAERARQLLPMDTLLASLPPLHVGTAEAARLLLGQKLGLRDAKVIGFARIYGPNQRFLGLVEVGEGGRTVPYRMLAQSATVHDEMLEKTPG